MDRVLEPEIMAGDSASAYARAACDDANLGFSEQLVGAFHDLASSDGLRVLDVGSGPGDIGVWLAHRYAGMHLTLLDASADMLRFAQRRVADAGLSERFEIRLGRVPEVELEPTSFDLLISNTFLHHVPEPRKFWAWAKPLVKPTGAFFVRDLRRPNSAAEVEVLVERYVGDAEPAHRDDYRSSYFAALTTEEVASDLRAVGLDQLRVESLLDRYWLVHGRRRG